MRMNKSRHNTVNVHAYRRMPKITLTFKLCFVALIFFWHFNDGNPECECAELDGYAHFDDRPSMCHCCLEKKMNKFW
jgi:hypothetical protein